MEDNCHFVNSRGILKSCDFHSPNPISSLCYNTEYLHEMLESGNMFDNMSIYICTDMIFYFLKEILPKINNNFYLVTGDSDATVPNGYCFIWKYKIKLEPEVCYEILKHPRLIKWFSQNCIFTNDVNDCNNKNDFKFYNNIENNANNKICQLPIGLDYHTISNNPSVFWRDVNEGFSVKYQENILKNIRKSMKPFYERTKKIYVQMTLTESRQKDLSQISNELLEINTNSMCRTKIWKEIANYAFAFSPYGNGPDCHRHWEILSLGCIPIIKSIGTNEMFNDLPVLIVDEWSDINEKLLNDTIKKFKTAHFNYDKLLLKYWVNQFSTPP